MSVVYTGSCYSYEYIPCRIRRYRQKFRPLALSMLVLCLNACTRDIHDHPDLITGKALFNFHCKECHLGSGTGNFLYGVPANKNTDLSTSQISHMIRHNGEPGRNMPIFATMGNSEVIKIAEYLKEM